VRLSPTEITIENGEVILSARVTFDRPLLNKPDRLWFSFPEKYAPFVTRRSDAFAVGLILLAMYSGENLIVEGELSPRLVRGLTEYQRAFRFWFPEKLSVINIEAQSLCELSPEEAGKQTFTLFSGGVDSAYTLMKHLPEHQPLPDFQVKYGLFIHGLDIPLQNRGSFDAACRTFTRELSTVGVELIPVRTNLRYFTSGLLPWMIAHGSATIAAGLMLDRLCANLLVPASHTLDDFKPWGSSPLVDHWLSTETNTIIHHGITASRMDKISAIANWQPAQNFLRVCINEGGRDGVQNCSLCEKCFRTMAMLEMCGTLEHFNTFNKKITRRDIARWTPTYNHGVMHTPAMRKYALQTGKTEYLLPISIAHLRGQAKRYFQKLIPTGLFNQLKKQKFPYDKDPFNPANL
jgi:hypothetical protein